MEIKGFTEIERISQAVGNLPEYVQGGGGNTSVKLDSELMAVKASGYKLNQVSSNEGFVVVNYRSIGEYFNNIDHDSKRDYEKESGEFLRNSVIEIEGLKKLRPSVEAGFHSILKKYVLHTHPVYANMLCCSQEGREIAGAIFNTPEYSYGWVPYVNPGFGLTMEIQKEINSCIEKKKYFPKIIFMENHGLIVNSDDMEECVNLHAKVNSLIREYFKINPKYPVIKLEKKDDTTYISKTAFLNDYFKGNTSFNEEYLERYSLYPDQLVYLNNSVMVNKPGSKLNIDMAEGKLTYNAGYEEARTIEETLLAVLYIIKSIEEAGLSLKSMTDSQKSFINGWESEKYRKSVIKG